VVRCKEHSGNGKLPVTRGLEVNIKLAVTTDIKNPTRSVTNTFAESITVINDTTDNHQENNIRQQPGEYCLVL